MGILFILSLFLFLLFRFPVASVSAQTREQVTKQDLSVIQKLSNFSFSLMANAFKKPPVIQKLPKKYYRSDEEVTFAVANTQNKPVKVEIFGADGKKADVAVEQTKTTDQVVVDLVPQTQIRPGKYKIVVTDSDGKKSVQDFSWGVLALNTNRSSYQPGQKANISMAVLDDKGAMICDAKVTLEITHPKLKTTLSTDNGKIVTNKQCASHSFSLEPDYEANYTVEEEGTYTMMLTAETRNGKYTITDSFKAQRDPPFEVERVSATRIYPPNNYPVKLTITAKHDFEGTITETVPESFVITPSDEAKPYDVAKTLYLEKKDDPSIDVLGATTSASSSGLLLPFAGSFSITQRFGMLNTDDLLSKFYEHYSLSGHDGVDLGLPENTPLFAVDDGNVVFAGEGDYGITVIMQHEWGKSYYGHLNKLSITKDQHITKGAEIGLSGNTGESTGPHLHFGIKPNNPDMNNGYFGKVDPLPYFKLPSTTLIADNTQAVVKDTAVLGAATASSAAAFTTLEPQQRNEELNSSTIAHGGKVKLLQWHVNLKKGEETTLSYQFKAPNISPQFYLLGPVRMYAKDKRKPIFEELRQWQIAADAVGDDWYNDGTPYGGLSWPYRKMITIDSTKVSSTQTNFPVLINQATDANLAADAQSDGDDIVFTDENGTKLSHEIERFTPGTGELIAWVKIPSLSSSTNTTLYMYYGNQSASNQENVSNVWTNSYMGVWHLREDPATTCNNTQEFCDSVASNDGDAQGTMTAADRITGQIGYGTDLDGINDYIYTLTAYNNPQNLTVSTWLKTNTTGRKVIGFENNQTGTGSQAYDRHIYVDTSGKARMGSYDGEPPDTAISSASVTGGTWKYVVGTTDDTNNLLSVYVNGATPQTAVNTSAQAATVYFKIGAYKLAGWAGGSDGYYAGQVDEVRVASVVRSQGWITTEYNNQSSPSTFYSLGNFETKTTILDMDKKMRHGKGFNNAGIKQPFLF